MNFFYFTEFFSKWNSRSYFAGHHSVPSSALLSTTRGPTAMAAADYALPSCCDSAPPSTPLSPLFLHSPPSHSPFPSPKSKSNLNFLVFPIRVFNPANLSTGPRLPLSAILLATHPPKPLFTPFPVLTGTPALP